VLLRFGAGLAMVMAPIAALWLGSVLASAMAVIPPGLHAYPHAVALRFAVAVVLAFSIFFAISAGTARTAGYILTIVGGLFVTQLLLELSGSSTNIVMPIFDRMVTLPGPFEIFTGRWMLIDV
jgi:hypothetical protein